MIDNFEEIIIFFLTENEIDYFDLELVRLECFLELMNFL